MDFPVADRLVGFHLLSYHRDTLLLSILYKLVEATGVYWIPLFEMLEMAGFRCCLISSRSLRRIPGRKSDVLDCQWIQTLHSYGLLESSFRPEADLVAMRTLLRHRAQLLEHRAPHILHMQKALLQTCAEPAEA